eukprot:TRINITY_DN4542_c0_g1_i1.p1 TRINITY_DN4542_c0_g1~~TRINITY_DN4542_c0_g1_i1.p1  ORF type:complete len:301 (+),score=29.85 TRINITY_DN4542_c0_g1_i1:24-926(+)
MIGGIKLITLFLIFVYISHASAAGSDNTTCLQSKFDKCHRSNGNCSGCIAIEGCGYCNDWMQCLPGDSMGPTVDGCICNVWITTPTMCQEGLCAVKNGCQECSQRTYCIWCEEKGLCLPGGLFGPTDGSQCGDWTWYHCGGVSGTIVLVILGLSLLGLVIIISGTVLIVKRVKAKKEPRTMFLPSSRRREAKPLIANGNNNVNTSSSEDIKPKPARRPSPILEEDEEETPLNPARGRSRQSNSVPVNNNRSSLNTSSKRVMAMSPAAIPSTPISTRSALTGNSDTQSERSKLLDEDNESI